MAEKKWVVLSTRLYTLHPDGNGDPRRQKKHLRGDVLTGLSEDDVTRFTKAGAIAPHGSDAAESAQNPGAAAVVHPAGDPVADLYAEGVAAAGAAVDLDEDPAVAPTSVVSISDGAEQVKRPPKSATKDKLVKYAVESGQMTEEQALATPRNKLRDTLK